MDREKRINKLVGSKHFKEFYRKKKQDESVVCIRWLRENLEKWDWTWNPFGPEKEYVGTKRRRRVSLLPSFDEYGRVFTAVEGDKEISFEEFFCKEKTRWKRPIKYDRHGKWESGLKRYIKAKKESGR